MGFQKIFYAIALIPITAASLDAHHSFSALFDATETIAVTGEVTNFEFRAPHSYIHLAVRNPDGTQAAWQVETATPGMLIRKGINPETLRPGQTISVSGNPTRDGRRLIRLLTITMPDGEALQIQ